jgi:hypothetical protein
MKERKSKEENVLEELVGEIHDEYEGKNQAKPALSENVPGKLPGKTGKPAEKSAGPYLDDFSRVELLRGYIEALDEIRRNIDDAYRQKHEVRDPLEQFEKFCSTAIPALRRFQAGNDTELQAITDARTETQSRWKQRRMH